MTWIPPEVAQSTGSSTPSNGWIPPEVKKKEEPVFFGGSESLASPSAATEDNAVGDGAQLSFSGEQQTKTPDFMGMMDGGYKDQPSGVMKSVSEGLSKAEKPLEDKYAAYVNKKRAELTGGLKLPNPMEAVDPNQYQQDLDNYTRVLRENPMAEKEDNKITAIGMLINQTKDADRVIEDYSQQNVAEKVGSGMKKGFEDYGRGYFELFDRLKQNQAVKELNVKLEDLDKGKDVTLDEGDRLLAQSLVENGNKIKQLEALSPSAYNIGKMAGESLGFTGEFLLTGGIGAGLAKSITKGVATKVAEGAAVSAAKRVGVGLSAKMAQTGIQVAAMPTFYKGIAEDVSKGENFGESLFKNYYKTFAENFTERIFLKTPWDKATVGSVDKLFGRLGVNMHTEKGVVGILASTAEEAAEEKIGEIMTAPLDNNNFKEFWNNYWDVKKNGELLGSVALMTVPMGLVSYSAKKYDDVKLDRIGKLLPNGVRGELDQVLNDKKLTLKEQYDLIGKIVEDNAANKTLGNNLGESASNVIRYVQQKTKQNVVSAVEDRKEQGIPEDVTYTVGTREELPPPPSDKIIDENGNMVDYKPTAPQSPNAVMSDELTANRRQDLFPAESEFGNVIGHSGNTARLENYYEVDGIGFSEYVNTENGLVDVYMTGTSDNDFVGFIRVYENGKPTNRFTSKMENQSGNKQNFKTMLAEVQKRLPDEHEYTESTSVSTDGLRVFGQQLDRGYQIATDENGQPKTKRVAINGDAKSNVLGIDVNVGNFDNIEVKTKQDFDKVKAALIPMLTKLGLNESNVHHTNGTVEIDLPILKKAKQVETKKQEPVVVEEEIKPIETPSEAVQPLSTEKALIVPPKEEEGLKQQKEVVVVHAGSEPITLIDEAKLQSRDQGQYGKGFYVAKSETNQPFYGKVKSYFKIKPESKVLNKDTFDVEDWKKTQIESNGYKYEDVLSDPSKYDVEDILNVKSFDDAVRYDNKGINDYAREKQFDILEVNEDEIVVLNKDAVESQQRKQPIVGEQQIEQLKVEENGKETTDEAKGQGRQERLLEKNKKADDLLAEGLSDIADLLGTKLSLTGEQRVKVKDAVRKVAKGMILKGEVKVEQLAIAIKDYFSKAGHDISDDLINEALKEEQDAEAVRESNKGDVGAQKGVVEGTEGKLPVGNDGKDQKTPRGKDEVKQKATKLSSNGKDVIKIGHFAVRLSLEDTKLPQAVKDEVKDKGIGTYTVMSNENAYAIAKSISDSNSLEDLMPIVFSSDVHGGVRGAVMLEVQDRLNKEYYKAEKEGRTEDAKAWAAKQVEFYRQFNQSASNAGSFLQMLGSEKAMESFAPYAHVLKYEQDTQADRDEMQSSTTHKKSLEKTQKASKKAFNDAVDGAINDPKVKKIIAENEGKTINVKPDRLVELKAKEKALIEKLKKSFGKTLTSGGLTKEGIEALGELAVVYVEEAGYHVGNAVKKLIKTAKSIGYTMTEDEALKYMPSKIEGMAIKEKQKEEETQKAAEQLSNKIFGEVIGSKSKEDPLRQMVNTLLGKFKERDLSKEKKQQKTDIQKIADAIKEKYLYADVWNEAKDNAISKIEENKTLDESQKEDAIARVNDAYTKATSFTFTEAQVDRAIRRKMADLNIKVNDVVREFFDIRTAERTKLSDALIAEAGLSKDQAKILADAIEKRFDTLMSDSKKKIIEKYVGKIKEGESDVDKRTSKQRKDKAAELLELINIGAFDSKEFREAYATAVGIPAINEEHAAVIKNLGEQIAKAKEPFIRHRKVQDLLGYIKSIGGLSPSEMFKSLWYANTLSGIKTEERNIVGGASGVQLRILSDLLLSGRPSAALRGYKKGLSAGLTKAKDVIKEGYAVFDEKSERVDVPNSAEIFQMRKGLFKPIWNSLKYVGRTMNAFDIVNAESGKEAFAHILANEALNVSRWKSLVSSEYRKEVRLLTDKYLKTDKETVDRLKKEIEEDSEEFGYTEREKKLILLNKINNIRPTELSEESSRFGIYSTGNVPSYGTIGMVSDAIATALKNIAITYRSPKTGKQHSFAPLSLFAAFTKISGNVAEGGLNYIAPIGVYRAVRGGYGTTFNIGDKTPLSKYYREMTPRERKTALGQAVLGTIAMVGLYALSSPDDEGKSKIRITANGTGDYKKNKNLTDWQEYSIGYTDDNGKTTWISYKNTPLILALGVIGYIRDSKMYRDEYREVDDAELFTKGVQGMPSFLGDMSAIGSMTKVFDNLLNAGSSGTSTQSIPMLLGNTVKGFYTPAIYKDATDIMAQLWDLQVEQPIKGTSPLDMEANARKFFGRNPISIIKKIINKEEIVSAVDVYGREEKRLMPPDILIKMDDDPTEIDKLALYHQKYANVPSSPDPNRTTFEIFNEDGESKPELLDLNDRRQLLLWHTFVTKRGQLILDAIKENMDKKDQEYRDAIEPAIRQATRDARNEIEMELMDQPIK